MMKIFLLCLTALLIAGIVQTYSQPVIVQRDNNNPVTAGYASRPMWEETALLQPAGPCSVNEIQVYFIGNQPGPDTLFIVGDPSEGAICPTLWILSYNQKIPPIIVNYDGVPGWKTFPVTNLRSDGYDRIVIQHRLKANGPWFAYDNNGAGKPYASFLMDPTNVAQNGTGQFYLANGDFLVRIKVTYDFPQNNSSAPPPIPKLLEINKLANLPYISATDVTVVDYNNDGFDDIAIGSNLFKNNGDGTFTNQAGKTGINAGFSSWADLDGDGFPDLYAVTNGPWIDSLRMMVSTNKIYHNNGDGTFTAVDSKKAFLPPYPNPSDDFRLTKKYTQDSIHNPYSCISAVWFDFNNDGKPDLYLANNRVGLNDAQGNYTERYFPDQLWVNNGDNTFSLATKSSGMPQAEPFDPGTSYGYGYFDCYGACANDFNGDGKTDIFVANYRLARDILYKNNGNNTFTDVGPTTGVQGITTPSQLPNYFGHGMGAEWTDFNNDGYPDLAVGNLGHPDYRGIFSNPSLIFVNQGPPNFKFTDKHLELGLKFFEMNAGMLWADFDLDGYPDLWHGQISYNAEGTNDEPKRFGRFYINQGPPDYKLHDATWDLGDGVRVHGPWAAARIDFDHDGDLDVLVASNFEGVKLFRNDLQHKGSWLELKLRCSASNSLSSDAFGTNVTVYAGGKKFYRDLEGSAAGTKGSQNSFDLHFGLGNVQTLDSVVVKYPNGQKKIYTNLTVNTRYILPYMMSPQRDGVATPALDYPANFESQINTNVTIKWQPCGFAKSYTLQVSDKPDFSTTIVNQSNLTQTTYDLKVLKQNVTYYWKVNATDGTTTSQWSSVWVFTTGMPQPSKPVLINPANDTTGVPVVPTFSWHPCSLPYYYGSDLSYTILVSESQDMNNPDFNASGIKDTVWTLQGTLKPNTKYYWRVKSVNAGAPSEWSELWDFTTLSAPAKTTLLTPANGDTGVAVKPTLKWNPIAGAVKYHLQISPKSDFSNIFYDNSIITNTSQKILKTLNGGTVYYWRVSGINDGGEGLWSDAWMFTTAGPNDVADLTENNSGILLKCSPNPFDSRISIEYSVPSGGQTKIVLLDLRGELIETLYNSFSNPGWNQIEVTPKININGSYFLKIENSGKSLTEKIIRQR